MESIVDNPIITLTKEDWEIFVKMCNENKEPNDKLKELLNTEFLWEGRTEMDKLLKEQTDSLKKYFNGSRTTHEQCPFDELTMKQQLDEAKSFYDRMTAIEDRTRDVESGYTYLPEKY